MRVTYEQTSDDISYNRSTGEIISERQIKDVKTIYTKKIENEPDYIKVYKYVNTLFAFKGINQNLTPFIIEIANHMNYASNGQIVTLNKTVKDIIAKNLSVSPKRVDQVIRELRDCDILRKIQNGVYSVNPYICARGNWQDIRKLQAAYDFSSGQMTAIAETKDLITGQDIKKLITNSKKNNEQQVDGQLSLNDFLEGF